MNQTVFNRFIRTYFFRLQLCSTPSCIMHYEEMFGRTKSTRAAYSAAGAAFASNSAGVMVFCVKACVDRSARVGSQHPNAERRRHSTRTTTVGIPQRRDRKQVSSWGLRVRVGQTRGRETEAKESKRPICERSYTSACALYLHVCVRAW